MGSVGDSFDNALAENFFSSLKVERIYRTTYRTREEAELDLVRWIDGWYNPRRIQRELGWLSPDEYEETYYTRESSGTLASPAGARSPTLRGIGGSPDVVLQRAGCGWARAAGRHREIGSWRRTDGEQTAEG
jgi:Integrase core domain